MLPIISQIIYKSFWFNIIISKVFFHNLIIKIGDDFLYITAYLSY
nr:MAG TPA: hypothetical protein [Caudoviricetes sp.]